MSIKPNSNYKFDENESIYNKIDKGNNFNPQQMKLKAEILYKINDEYFDLLEEFEGKINNFILTCEDFILMNRNKFQEDITLRNHKNEIIQNEEFDFVKKMNFDEDITALGEYIFNLLLEKNVRFFKDKNFENSIYDTNTKTIVDNILENYLQEEKEFLIKNEINVNEKKEIKNSNLFEEKGNKENKKDLNLKIQINDLQKNFNFMKIAEIICIIILFVIYYLSIDVDELINKKNFNDFNQKHFSTFDEDNYCNKKFLEMTTISELDNWTIECYNIM